MGFKFLGDRELVHLMVVEYGSEIPNIYSCRYRIGSDYEELEVNFGIFSFFVTNNISGIEYRKKVRVYESEEFLKA